jgi:hypothetical protein
LSGHTGFDAITDPQYHALAGGEHGGGFRAVGAAGGVRAHHAHLAPDVLLQQLGRRQQVEVEVLLQQADRLAIRHP